MQSFIFLSGRGGTTKQVTIRGTTPAKRRPSKIPPHGEEFIFPGHLINYDSFVTQQNIIVLKHICNTICVT